GKCGKPRTGICRALSPGQTSGGCHRPMVTHTIPARPEGGTRMRKLVATAVSILVMFVLAAFFETSPVAGQPLPKAKGKGDPKKKGGPGDELRKAYDLLRRLRAENGAGRAEERIRDWTDRAAGFYRDGLRAQSAGDVYAAREYGAAAHHLARAA